MLTADQIEVLGEQARQITDPIVEFLIEDIARRVSEAGQLTGTASYQVWRLQQLGVSQRQLKKELRKRLKVSHRELRRLLTQAAEVGYDFDIRHLPYVQAVPFKSNDVIQAIVEAAVDMARSDLTNMVETLGFVNQDGVCRPLTEAYEKACDFAFQKVAFGAQDYNSAVRGAVRELAAKGIQTIDYESGVHTSLEAAVRRNVMGGLGLMQERISQQNHDDLGCDGWEISAHAASAPDHEPIQGKQYSDAQYTALNNSLVRRIGTLNCGHAAFPIILGVNSPQYTTEQLEAFRSENEKGIEYGGKHFTMYEATQHQRKLERAIRKRKKKILLDEGLHDEQRLAQDQTKLVRLNEEYARFTKAAGLRSQRERTMVAGFGVKEARAAQKGARDRIAEVGEAAAPHNWHTIPVSGGRTDTKYRMLQKPDISSPDALNRSIDDNVRSTNPGYKHGGPGYKQNCQRCVATYEMRRRGYDVIARPATVDSGGKLSAKDPLYRSWNQVFRDTHLAPCFGTDGGKAMALRQMQQWESGAVAMVAVQWKSGGAHVFIAQNVNGNIRFIDPQTGNLDCIEHFTKARNGATMIARIDNLEATELIELCIKNRGGKP